MQNFWLVGITGGSGSGKSTACRFLASLGYAVIDADKVGHSINAADEFRAEFGDACINPETGRVHRPYLRELIVKDKRVLEVTEKIMKPKIEAKILELADGHRNDGRIIAFLDAPLLFESGFDKRCQITVCVTAPMEARIDRVMKRDCQTRENTEGLIALQLPDEVKVERSGFAIENNADPEWLYWQTIDVLRQIHRKIIKV